jgi:uncharacterized protein (DUF1015 family)
VARIIQNKPLPTDIGNRDRHARAAAFFRECIRLGRIQRDAGPSLYIYQQQFDLTQAGSLVSYTRTGVIVLVKLVDFEEGIVFPHEYTLTGPKTDRYELLREIKSHTELIFGIVPDPNRDVFAAISGAITSPCLGSFVDDSNVRHSLYRNSDPAAAALLTKLAADRTILIADGHHRYETALRFAKETGNPDYEYVLMNLVSMADPGLVIRAFHRVLKKYPGTEGIDVGKKLCDYFAGVDLGAASLETLNDFLGAAGKHEMLFLDARSRHMFGLRLSEEGKRFLSHNARGMSVAWNHLDVSKINSIVVGGILGLPLDGTTLHDVMDYVNDAAAAYERTMAHPESFHGVFFIRPMDIAAINTIVSGKERMPQKSTNFFPKCYSGLVFNVMENL